MRSERIIITSLIIILGLLIVDVGIDAALKMQKIHQEIVQCRECAKSKDLLLGLTVSADLTIRAIERLDAKLETNIDRETAVYEQLKRLCDVLVMAMSAHKGVEQAQQAQAEIVK